jgi:hypothetical protein
MHAAPQAFRHALGVIAPSPTFHNTRTQPHSAHMRRWALSRQPPQSSRPLAHPSEDAQGGCSHQHVASADAAGGPPQIACHWATPRKRHANVYVGQGARCLNSWRGVFFVSWARSRASAFGQGVLHSLFPTDWAARVEWGWATHVDAHRRRNYRANFLTFLEASGRARESQCHHPSPFLCPRNTRKRRPQQMQCDVSMVLAALRGWL